MASSHWSTWGPNMKCWDSITSRTAASTSALIAEYWALRSSSGTCIFIRLFHLSIGLGSLAEFSRERSFLVQIEAPENAGLNFSIAVAALSTHHDPVRVWRLESMPMATHPTDLTGGVSDNQGKVRHVLGRSEEHTSELQSLTNLVCRLLLEKKKKTL